MTTRYLEAGDYVDGLRPQKGIQVQPAGLNKTFSGVVWLVNHHLHDRLCFVRREMPDAFGIPSTASLVGILFLSTGYGAVLGGGKKV
jgi:hypothetical protein